MKLSMTFLLVVGGMSVFQPALASETTVARADQLLAAAKAASGGARWDAVVGLEEHGVFAGSGLRGTFSLKVELPHVLGVQSTDLGNASQLEGWNGARAWTLDINKSVRVEDSREARARGIGRSYRAAYAFFWPERWPAERRYVGERNADGATYDAIEVAPKDSRPFEIWFDRDSHLIEREVDIGGAEPHSQIMTDYREVDGLRLPYAVRDTIGIARFDNVLTVGSLVTSREVDTGTFAVPQALPTGDPFPAGATAVTVPFRLDNGHIVVDVSVNGTPAQPFLLDSGAVALVDSGHAARLAIRSDGDAALGGAGEGTASMGLALLKTLQIGALRFDRQVVLTANLADVSRAGGQDVAGLFGFEVLQRAVTTIDYAQRLVTFTRPAAFVAPTGAAVVPLHFDRHMPMIRATVDGIEGEFQLDTGATSGLTLTRSFAAENHLIERTHAVRSVVSGQGVDGPTRALLGRADELDIGKLSISRPIALVSQASRGNGALTYAAGNIGSGTLRRFTVTLDYGHRAAYFVPNKDFSVPDVFDRSGMRLVANADGSLKVTAVTTGGAAEKADLEVGDRILAIDGLASGAVSLSELRDRFKGPVGTRYMLSVGRDGSEPRDVSLVLADLLN